MTVADVEKYLPHLQEFEQSATREDELHMLCEYWNLGVCLTPGRWIMIQIADDEGNANARRVAHIEGIYMHKSVAYLGAYVHYHEHALQFEADGTAYLRLPSTGE